MQMEQIGCFGILVSTCQHLSEQEENGDFSSGMLDGHWLPQTGGHGVSCEDQGNILTVDESVRKVFGDTIKEAKLTGDLFKDRLDPLWLEFTAFDTVSDIIYIDFGHPY